MTPVLRVTGAIIPFRRGRRSLPPIGADITLPKATMRLLDRVTKKGNRSRFIDQAIREFALGRTRTQLRKLLEEEGRVNRDRDLRLAAEWAPVDAETWPVPRRR